MKIKCECGNILSDTTDYLPFKAHFIKDVDIEKKYQGWEMVKDYLKALASGNRRAFIKSYYGAEIELDDTSMIHDIVEGHQFHSVMYQCPNCNGILIWNDKVKRFNFFQKVDSDSDKILS
jgi:hypothetical protein